jgi:hypothetical protein
LSKLQRFLLDAAHGHDGRAVLVAHKGGRDLWRAVCTGTEVLVRDLRVKYFGRDSRAAQAATSRALTRLWQRRLLNCVGGLSEFRYALPGVELRKEQDCQHEPVDVEGAAANVAAHYRDMADAFDGKKTVVVDVEGKAVNG